MFLRTRSRVGFRHHDIQYSSSSLRFKSLVTVSESTELTSDHYVMNLCLRIAFTPNGGDEGLSQPTGNAVEKGESYVPYVA